MSALFDQTNGEGRTVHLRIRRLAVDAAALGDLPRERLAEQLQAALAQRLSVATNHAPARGLAQNIVDAVAPQVDARLAEQTDGKIRGRE